MRYANFCETYLTAFRMRHCSKFSRFSPRVFYRTFLEGDHPHSPCGSLRCTRRTTAFISGNGRRPILRFLGCKSKCCGLVYMLTKRRAVIVLVRSRQANGFVHNWFCIVVLFLCFSSAMPPTMQAACAYANNRHYSPTNKLKVITNVHYSDCCDNCWRTDGCIGFAWQANVDGGTCILKNVLNSSVVEMGTISGMMDLTRQQRETCVFKENYNFPATVISATAIMAIDSREGCCAQCKLVASCVAFVWSTTGGCQLYDNYGTKPLVTTRGSTFGYIMEQASM